MDVCNFLYSSQIFDSWSHTEIKELKMFGEKISRETNYIGELFLKNIF